jgi:large subunit ribosomal protein L25
MSEVTLTAEPGRAAGTRSSNRLRAGGRVPAVVYGQGTDAVAVSVDRKDLRAALHTEAGHNAVINLEVGGDRLLTIVKSLQRHPVRNDVVHVDFIVVDRDQAVTVEVPVILAGEAVGVAREGGTVDQHLYTLAVQAKPGSIPNEITVDVSGLAIGDVIRVGDLPLPAGAGTEVDPEETVVSAGLTRAALAEEGEEGAEAGGEEGTGGDEAAKAPAGADASDEGAGEG